jgi:hypothetical protein
MLKRLNIKLVFLVGGFTLAAQAGIVVDRGLPTSNLNDAAGANRSNVTWGYDNEFFSGDNFSLAAGLWRIDSLRIWTVDGTPGVSTFHLGQDYSSVALYGGLATDGVSLLKSGTLSSSANTSGNPDITIAPVQYIADLDYQTTSTQVTQIWQIDFNNLNWLVSGGTLLKFGVLGTALDPNNNSWVNHASNAGLSGSTQQGSDGLFRYFDTADLATGDGLTSSSSGFCPSPAADCGGWDKTSDVNVQVFATAQTETVPEPGTMMLLAAGLAGLGLRLRSKSRV